MALAENGSNFIVGPYRNLPLRKGTVIIYPPPVRQLCFIGQNPAIGILFCSVPLIRSTPHLFYQRKLAATHIYRKYEFLICSTRI